MKLIKKFIDSNYVIWIILGLALILRSISLNQSLWLDEAIGAVVVKDFTFRDILLKFPLGDNHPPLYYLLLKAWSVFFGYSEVSLRTPSVIFGVLTVYFVYKISKDFTKMNPVIPAIFVTTSPLAIYYSQEARMYTLAGFLATAAIYFYLKTFRNASESKNWIWFSFFYALLIFSDYMPVFLYLVFFLYPLLTKTSWDWWKKFIVANVPLAILGVLWAPIFIQQGAGGSRLLETLPAWKTVAGGATFKQLGVFWSKFVLGRISLVNKYLYYSLITLASVPIIAGLCKSLKEYKKIGIFWLWFILPIILGFLASFAFPAFIYFRYIFVLPAFYILIALGISVFRKKISFVIVAVIVFNLLGLGIYYFDQSQHREDWAGAVAYVEENASLGEVSIFGNPEPFAPYRWYWAGKVESFGVTNSIAIDQEKTFEIMQEKLSGKTGVYYFEYLRGLQDPNSFVQESLDKMGYIEVGRQDFRGVGFVIHFKKQTLYALD